MARLKPPTYVPARFARRSTGPCGSYVGIMKVRPRLRIVVSAPSIGGPVSLAAAVALSPLLGETNLQMTNDLLWVMTGLAVAGAIITFAFLVYAIVHFRDPRMKGHRHG